MDLQNAKRGSPARKRRQENIDWVRQLDLEQLAYNKTERQASVVTTGQGERIAIQYPGKESIQGRKKWKNDWDFRPKLVNRENVDLTFEQIWDPLFEDLRQLAGESRRQVGSVLATLYYRIAYMVDYVKSLEDRYPTKTIQVGPSLAEEVNSSSIEVGPFWAYKPPSPWHNRWHLRLVQVLTWYTIVKDRLLHQTHASFGQSFENGSETRPTNYRVS